LGDVLPLVEFIRAAHGELEDDLGAFVLFVLPIQIRQHDVVYVDDRVANSNQHVTFPFLAAR
jgi:hypothetical protein